MKREIFAACLLVLMLTLSIINIHYLKSITHELTGYIENCIESADADDWEGAEKYAKQAKEKWYDYRTYTSLFLKHDKIDQITDSFTDIFSSIYKHDQISSSAAGNKLIDNLEKIIFMEQLKIGTIF